MVYWPLLLLRQVAAPALAGKLCILSIVLGSVASLHVLAARRARDPQLAVLASMLLFSAPLYWGFLNFLSGLPLFLWFSLRSLDRQGSSIRSLAGDALLLLSLCWAHVLWVPFSFVVCLVGLVNSRNRRDTLLRVAAFLPAGIWLLLWYPTLIAARRDAGFDLGTYYLIPLSDRFSLEWLVQVLFGGIRGAAEYVVTIALLILFGIATRNVARRRTFAALDVLLLAVACTLLLFSLLAPDQHMNTVLFGRRFAPVGAMFGLLSLPELKGRVMRAGTLLLAAGFAIMTTLAWALYDIEDLSGLDESLDQISAPTSVLGLDQQRTSRFLYGYPFLQIFAYFQATHGGELNFSFAEHATSIVAYRGPRALAWTPGLEWHPERVTSEDVRRFDCTLLSGSDGDHRTFQRTYGITSSSAEGRFRLYCRP